MKNTARYRRTAAALGLVLAAVLMAVAMGTNVPFSGEADEVLDTMSAAGGRAWVSAFAYLLAQLALIPGLLGVAHLLRERTPMLSNIGGTLAVLGAFGHTVHGGGVLVIISMAQGSADPTTAATVLQEYVSSPSGLFSATGLVGTVLGLVLLTIGLWRAGVGPRWVPLTLVGFVLVEFVGTAITPLASVFGGALYVVSFAALANTILRSHLDVWEVHSLLEDPESVTA